MEPTNFPLPLLSGLTSLGGTVRLDASQVVVWSGIKLQFDSAIEHAYRSADKTRQTDAELEVRRIAEAWRTDSRSHSSIRVVTNHEIGL